MLNTGTAHTENIGFQYTWKASAAEFEPRTHFGGCGVRSGSLLAHTSSFGHTYVLTFLRSYVISFHGTETISRN